MTDRRHAPSSYARFMSSVDEAGGVPCQEFPEVFFPEDFPEKLTREAAIASARLLCSGCPVRLACFEYAVSSNQRFGIWAGTLPSER
jgi:hypothetical protein